ncbi:14585_t:CDS:1, partial [Gigaspora rosea]
MAGAIEFPDLNKINFKTLMNGMVLNGSNWVQFINHFEHAIQVYVLLDLLTTGHFTGNYNNRYNRFDLGDIANKIAGNADAKGAYNVIFMKNLIHKLAVSCFDYNRYILYETHKNDLALYFPSDFNRVARRKRHDWESVEDDPTTILLDKTYFQKKWTYTSP